MEWFTTISLATDGYPVTVMLSGVTACYLLYYLLEVVKRPLVVCKEGPWRDFLLEHMPILQANYYPTFWCVDGRLQSLLGCFLRGLMSDMPYERELFDLKDGGTISLDWVSRPKGEARPILLFLPGLTGTSQSGYIKGFIHRLGRTDASCVVLNYRGMAGTELKTTRTFCKANSDDLEEVLGHVTSLYPKSPVVAVGISLGGIWITNYLATRGDKASQYLAAALVFSVPWNLFTATESLETPGLNLVINRSITRSLCAIYERYRKHLDGEGHPWQYDTVMKSELIRDFDNNFTALNFGFRDVHDYYRAASLHDRLHEIKVPLLCLNAEDDFFQPLRGIPITRAKCSSHVALVVTSRGGHVGFMEGLFPYKCYYSDRIFGEFAEAVLSNLERIRGFKMPAGPCTEGCDSETRQT
ncbi:phospholipase ABHD3-like [Palaemon carinicauda]|uniref:phospholipase ABHD3-like n=1 Tax=Palaemon carinicauda TaxID=392227 RepID=UPI0035B59FB1